MQLQLQPRLLLPKLRLLPQQLPQFRTLRPIFHQVGWKPRIRQLADRTM